MFNAKYVMLLLSVIVTFLGASCHKQVDIENEKEVVKKIIVMQNTAANEKSLSGEEAVWAHVPYAYRRVNYGKYKAGWDSISALYKKNFANKTPDSEEYKDSWQNWDIHFWGQMAWAAYNHLIITKNDTFTFRELRFLERQNNQWKIIFQETDFLGFITNPGWRSLESELNNIGYALLKISKIPEAIKVLKMNIEFFPDSSNVYDSLGDAYLAANDKKNAASSFKKAVEKDPKNKISAEKLKKLL